MCIAHFLLEGEAIALLSSKKESITPPKRLVSIALDPIVNF